MSQKATPYVLLSAEAQKTLFTDICQRNTIEACGVLLGRIDEENNWHIEQAYPLRNVFDSPVYFEFDPEELLNTELMYPEQIVGVYHSHPTGFPRASSTDQQNMQRVNQEQHIPWIWFIISGPFTDHFIQRTQKQGIVASTIAYYHFPHQGLKEIPIQLETADKGVQK